jgi:surface protein
VFYGASAFNQDVSKWNTGAVTNMYMSKCTLSPSLWPRLPLLCILNIRQLEFHRIPILTRFVNLCCVFETVLFFVVCGGLVFLFFVAPSLLAVFWYASAFNQDVSKWNTGVVTNMGSSKCTLSPSLWPRFPLLCILNIRQLEFHRITILTRFVILILLF